MDKKQRNKYQILTLLFLIIGFLYVWQFYQSFQVITDNRTGKIVFNGVVMVVAFFVSWYYFKQAQKYVKKD